MVHTGFQLVESRFMANQTQYDPAFQRRRFRCWQKILSMAAHATLEENDCRLEDTFVGLSSKYSSLSCRHYADFLRSDGKSMIFPRCSGGTHFTFCLNRAGI